MNDAFITPQTDNEVVGYYADMVIVKREDGTLFYSDIPARLTAIGEVFPENDLIPISKLPTKQQEDIIKRYGD